MKIGDNVKVVAIPGRLPGEVRTIFELCMGREFPVFGIVPVPEIDSQLLELHVGEVVGQPDYMHSIWIEKEFVAIAEISTGD
jgi:hypothetical protein